MLCYPFHIDGYDLIVFCPCRAHNNNNIQNIVAIATIVVVTATSGGVCVLSHYGRVYPCSVQSCSVENSHIMCESIQHKYTIWYTRLYANGICSSVMLTKYYLQTSNIYYTKYIDVRIRSSISCLVAIA